MLPFCTEILLRFLLLRSTFQDSEYKPIVRRVKKFNPLVTSKKLQEALPFKSKPKTLVKRSRATLATKRAVVLEGTEKKVHIMMQQLNTMRHDKEAKRKEANAKQRQVHSINLRQ